MTVLPRETAGKQPAIGHPQGASPGESEMAFELDIWEMDNVDLAGQEESARKIALFEEQVIFQGWPSIHTR